ncbi:MAG: hypothetical protein AMJ79_14930 [Phycisphaerae bacterium SM23_30]|nr:MAG: hypothetical protein AMJ79_14930 [Phycisphaerae bacterium SM23_30]
MISDDDPQFTRSTEEALTEYHVVDTLRTLGHEVSVQGAVGDLPALVSSLTEEAPDLVFNLTEQYGGDRRLDKNITALLELLDLPYTGTGSMGLLLCRDKRLCKQLLSLHKIRVPQFISLPTGRSLQVPRKLPYPLVVKPAFEDGSEGISNASLVYNENALRERAAFVHDRWDQAAIAEEYIEGQELYVSLMGNKRLTVFPIRGCIFDYDGEEGPNLVTYRVKWNKEYQEKWNIRFAFIPFELDIVRKIERICKKVYRVLQLRDYGRIDVRLTPDNKLVVLEANPNPDIAYGDEVAEAAEKFGLSYENLIDRILRNALRRYEQRAK